MAAKDNDSSDLTSDLADCTSHVRFWMYAGGIAGLLLGTPLQLFVIMLFKEYREELITAGDGKDDEEDHSEKQPLLGEG